MTGSVRGEAIAASMMIMLLALSLLPFPLERSNASGNDLPRTLVVGSDEDHDTISQAILNAVPGDTIRVMPGTYVENIVVDKRITLVGNSSGECIIDGGGRNDTVTVSAGFVTIKGLTIRNSGSGERFGRGGYKYDAGICVNSSFLTVIGCNLSDNPRTSFFFTASGDYTVIRDCEFHGHTMNHIRFSQSYENRGLVISGCRFYNDAYDIVFYSSRQVHDLIVIDSEFIGQGGDQFNDGISFAFWSEYDKLMNATIIGNTFDGTHYGINLNAGTGVTISYNTFVNTTEYALSVSTSKGVRVHHNNFIGCGHHESQALNEDEKALWNDISGEGNYWSDHRDRYPQSGGYPITPYGIDGSAGASDIAPLIGMATPHPPFDFPTKVILPPGAYRVRCGWSFEVPIGIYDPDTPIESITGTIGGGQNWLRFSNGSIHGTVPEEETVGDRTVVVTLSDGKNRCEVGIVLRVLPKEQLVGCWDMTSNDHGSIVDSSEGGWNGTIGGNASFVDGLKGTALWMDGYKDSVHFGEKEDRTYLDQFTISLLAYPMTHAPVAEELLWIGDGAHYSSHFSIVLDWSDQGRVVFSHHDPSGQGTWTSSMPVNVDAWNHIALTYDGANLRSYIDGSFDSERDAALTLTFPRDLSFGAGRGDDLGFMGILDEVSIWNYAVSEGAIDDLHDGYAADIADFVRMPWIEERLDLDRDSLPDAWEIEHFGETNLDQHMDPDEDGLSNLEEFELGSDPADIDDPFAGGDSDEDGMSDRWEVQQFGDRNEDPRSDHDSDGYDNLQEYEAGSDPTDPYDPDPDRDDDSLPDEWEMQNYGNLMHGPDEDTDSDGYTSLEEYGLGSDPTWTFDPGFKPGFDDDGLPNDWEFRHFDDIDQGPDDDPDHDGYSNLREYRDGTDPTDPDDFHKAFPYWILFSLLGTAVLASILVLGVFLFLRFVLKERG